MWRGVVIIPFRKIPYPFNGCSLKAPPFPSLARCSRLPPNLTTPPTCLRNSQQPRLRTECRSDILGMHRGRAPFPPFPASRHKILWLGTRGRPHISESQGVAPRVARETPAKLRSGKVAPWSIVTLWDCCPTHTTNVWGHNNVWGLSL